MTAALAAGVPGVKVRALEWKRDETEAGNEYDVADTPWGEYTIEADPFSFSPTTAYYVVDQAKFKAQCASPEAAKAAAQADYEARILSALEPAPSALVAAPSADWKAGYSAATRDANTLSHRAALVAEPGEPVAWEQRHRENSGEWSKWYPTSKKAFDLIGTEPDGSLQARPLYAAPPARQDGALREAWRCFHCDEVFIDEDRAREHFGVDESREVACRIKSGAEGSMLTALRRAEADAADAWFKLQNESGEAAQAYYAQAARHQEQLRAAEELGYERGLRDAALAQSAAPVQPGAVAWPSGFFPLSGDARLRECATEGCGQHVSIRIERDGVGSDHCEPCARKIAEFVDRPVQQAAPSGEGE